MMEGNSMVKTEKFYINGSWTAPQTTATIDVVNPTTGEVIANVPQGTVADADAAVTAARGAFTAWSETSPDERASFLARICDGLEARRDELVETVTAELGMPVGMTRDMQVDLAVAESRHHVETLADFPSGETIGNSEIVHEAVGVVVGITPWNYPLVQMMRKVAPALAAGCTIVVKPSEETPLNAFILAEVIDEVGLPVGVFNLVTGYGPEIGEALASHPEVDMISLTGSTAAGRRVSELAAKTIKRVSLELGGKSANVVLDDADMDLAAEATLGWCYLNSGQTCSALTRLVVPRSRLAEAEEAVIRVTAKHVVGDPTAEGTTMGPLVSAKQRDRVLSYIRKGIDEGARVVLGGIDGQDADRPGFFVNPTVFSDVKHGMTIEQEEIFGPVLTIIPYDSEEEAIEIANGTIYGLAAAVWAKDKDRARAVGRKLRAGQVEINGGEFNSFAPFGGFKQSGFGRENGRYGFEEFLEVKSLQL